MKYGIHEIETRIKNHWERGQERLDLFQAIVDSCKDDDHPSITVGQMLKLTSLEIGEIINFMEFLCSDDLNLFDPQFHIYGPNGSFHRVSMDFAVKAFKQGYVEIPESGEKYDDVMKWLTMYFEPTFSFGPLLIQQRDDTRDEVRG